MTGRSLVRQLAWALLLAIPAAVCLSAGEAQNGEDNSPAASAKRYTEQGLVFYKQGDLKSSLKFLDLAVQADPSFLPAYGARAHAYHALDNDAAMRADMEKAHAMTAADPLTLTIRGNLKILEGDTAEAIDDFNTALSRNSRYTDALLGRGRAYRALGNLKEAEADWTRVLAAEPKMVIALFDRGRALRALGDPAKATDDFLKAMRLNPSFYLPYVQMGEIFSEHAEYSRAILSYTKALAMNPEYGFGYAARALAYLQLGDAANADKDFEKAIAVSRGQYWPYFERGEVRWRMGDKEAAVADFKKATAFPIDYTPAAASMGDRLASLGMTADAGRMYAKAVEAAGSAPLSLRVPWTEKALLKRAEFFQDNHDDKRALDDINQAVDISSDSPTALIARANFYFRTGQPSKTKRELDHILADFPSFAPGLLLKGKLLANRQQWKEALECFDSAVQAVPNFAEAYNARGLVYLHGLKEFDKAVDDFKKALTISPGNGDGCFYLAQAELRNRNLRQALELFDRALDAKPVSVTRLQILQGRGEAYAALGKSRAAMADLQAALALDPKSGELLATISGLHLRALEPEAAVKDVDRAESGGYRSFETLLNSGIAYGMLGDYDQSVARLKNAVSMRSGAAEAKGALCRALRLKKDFRAAIKTCNQAIALNADNGWLYIDRGVARLWQGDYQAAVADFKAAAEHGVHSASGELARSAAHAMLRQFQEADRAYRAATDIDPAVRGMDVGFIGGKPSDSPDYAAFFAGKYEKIADQNDPYWFLFRGNALNNSNQFQNAVTEYTRALQIDAGIPAAFLDRCDALSAQQSFDAAERDCRHAVELAPTDAQASLRLILLLTIRQRYKDGLDAAAAAIRLIPHSAPLYVRAGNLRYFMKDIPKAVDNFKLAVAEDPRDADAYNGLGLCQYARKEYADAIETFSKAITIEPRRDRYYRNRASTFAGMGDFGDAAADYRSALAVNTDPDMAGEYQRLLDNAAAKAPLSLAP